MTSDDADDDKAKVLSFREAQLSRKHVFTLEHIDDDTPVEPLVWVTEGVQEDEGQTRVALEAPVNPDADGWALTPDQALRVAAELVRAAQYATDGEG
jgi:hypothetical protein